MCAELIAVGPYSEAVADFLDYEPMLYADTREGAIVSRRLFGIGEGSGLSREFAAWLGIADPWDFNQHKVIPAKVDLAGLRAFATQYTEYDEDVLAFEALLKAGFEFHFRPEG